jgi:hypothetical protein
MSSESNFVHCGTAQCECDVVNQRGYCFSSNIPAHKQTNPYIKPGQVINPMPKPTPSPEKQTFTEWFEEYTKQHGLPPAYIVAGHAWAAGQRNK